ncbi:MAG: nucleotidyltransferase family protein [Vampirovibrionales bacterium]
MKTTEEVIAILRREKESLQARWPIDNLALFGSVARGEHTPQSDVDVLLDMTAPMGFEFFDMVADFEQRLGFRVDLVERSQIKPKAWKYISKEVIHV